MDYREVTSRRPESSLAMLTPLLSSPFCCDPRQCRRIPRAQRAASGSPRGWKHVLTVPSASPAARQTARTSTTRCTAIPAGIGTPDPNPIIVSKPVFLLKFSQPCVFLNLLSGALVWGRGFRFHWLGKRLPLLRLYPIVTGYLVFYWASVFAMGTEL